MRIIHIIDYFQPKLGYQETHLAQTQILDGHDVFVVTSERFSPILYPAAQPILGERIQQSGVSTEEGIFVIRLPLFLEQFGKIWLRGLRKTLVALKPDLIIIHGVISMTTLQLAIASEQIPKSRIVVDDHMVDSASRRPFRLFYFIFRILFSKFLQKRLDAFIATGKESIHFMIDNYGFPLERIRYIPLGCNTSQFKKNNRDRNHIRTTLGIPENVVVFIYAGKIIPQKGPHILMKAAIQLMKEYDRIHLLIVGNGHQEYIDIAKEIVRKSGFSKNFTFIDMVPHINLPKYYSASDIGVWPLQCSLTMIEAMSSGLPIIISDDSGAPERVETGTGFLYKSRDVSDLKMKMALLLEPGVREEMGRNAREYAMRHDWSKISKQFMIV